MLNDKLMNKRVLITGAAGFLGSHLCDRFISEGFEVIGVDNFITGLRLNIEHMLINPNFKFIEHDIVSQLDIDGPLDFIVHFASPASPKDHLKMPIQTLMANSLGTYNLLELATRKFARILVASTSEIYGDPKSHPQAESYNGNVNTIGPRSSYDEGKRFQEAITMAYRRIHGLETRIARIFNTYGPRMKIDDGRVIPAFIGQALENKSLTVFGDGSQTRSFCYVDDLVDGIYKLLYSDYHLPVNLGNPDEVSILEFAREIIKVSKLNLGIVFESLPEDDPSRRRPDISLAKKVLNWSPKTSRKEGIMLTFKFFKDQKTSE